MPLRALPLPGINDSRAIVHSTTLQVGQAQRLGAMQTGGQELARTRLSVQQRASCGPCALRIRRPLALGCGYFPTSPLLCKAADRGDMTGSGSQKAGVRRGGIAQVH